MISEHQISREDDFVGMIIALLFASVMGCVMCIGCIGSGHPGALLIIGPYTGFWIWGLVHSLEEYGKKQDYELQKAADHAAARQKREDEERRRNSPEALAATEAEAKRCREDAEQRKRDEQRRRKKKEERVAREKWSLFHRSMRIEEIDDMTGVQFEQFIKTLLIKLGHTKVKDTPVSGDQGADIVSELKGDVVVCQTKRWKGVVGNSAIQEILGALLFYSADVGIVVTNSRFTSAAQELAGRDKRISLFDRTELNRLIANNFPRDIPEFNWDDYQQCVASWSPQPEPLVKRAKAEKRRQW